MNSEFKLLEKDCDNAMRAWRKSMDTKNMTVGQQMRSKRLGAGYSLRKAAGLLGISAPYLADLERGRRNWDDRKVNDFSQLYNVAADVKASWDSKSSR